MCVTNIYVDLYPDGRRQEFRQTSICQYGLPGRPCAKTSTLENPIRKIQWGEPTTQYMLTSHQRVFPAQIFPSTPPRSSGGSHHRRSGGYSSGEEGLRGRRRESGGSRYHHLSPAPPATRPRQEQAVPRRATREHRKERIIIVDSPPTPRTPPQAYNQVFTAPNSPSARPGRPVIVDERPRPRMPSNGAVVGDRERIPFIVRRSTSSSRPRYTPAFDSPSSSHTSFDLHTHSKTHRISTSISDTEDDATAKRRRERNERISALEADRRRASFIARQDEEIRRRPAIPLVAPQNRNSAFLRPVVDQGLADGVAGVRIGGVGEERAAAARKRWEAAEEEAMRQRLRERQMPARRFSVGPAQRRHRVLYDDGVYRWE